MKKSTLLALSLLSIATIHSMENEPRTPKAPPRSLQRKKSQREDTRTPTPWSHGSEEAPSSWEAAHDSAKQVLKADLRLADFYELSGEKVWTPYHPERQRTLTDVVREFAFFKKFSGGRSSSPLQLAVHKCYRENCSGYARVLEETRMNAQDIGIAELFEDTELWDTLPHTFQLRIMNSSCTAH